MLQPVSGTILYRFWGNPHDRVAVLKYGIYSFKITVPRQQVATRHVTALAFVAPGRRRHVTFRGPSLSRR